MSSRRTLAKLRTFFHRECTDLTEEIQSHLAMEEADNLARGMSLEEARLAARQRFGNITHTIHSRRSLPL